MPPHRGDVAVDGTGANSPYTASLVKHMNEPGVPIEKVFRNVRNEVRSKTGNQQTPWESSSLIGGDFYFKTVIEVESTEQGQEVTVTTSGTQQPTSTSTTTATPGTPVTTTTTAVQPVIVGGNRNIELVFWDTVKDSNNPQVLQAYINKYPQGIFVELAQLKIDAMGGLPTQAKQPAPQPAVEVAKPTTVQVVAKPEPAPKPKPAEPIKLAAVVADPTVDKMKECNGHFAANRLTSGQGGNALECYYQVLQMQVGHPGAMAGITDIENKYARWAAVALDRNDPKKAARNIKKLRALNEEHPQLAGLDNRLAVMLVAAQAPKAEEPKQAPAQPAAEVKVAAVKQPAAPKAAAPSSNTSQCDAYIDQGKLVGRGTDNAVKCFLGLLSQNSNDQSAQKGLARAELAVFQQFQAQIKDKSLRNAEKTMKQLKRTNRKSKHLRKMRMLYEELKMEMRW